MQCHNCGCHDLIAGEFQFGFGSVIIRPTDQNILSLGLNPRPYVCRNCGSVSTYIDVDELNKQIEERETESSLVLIR